MTENQSAVVLVRVSRGIEQPLSLHSLCVNEPQTQHCRPADPRNVSVALNGASFSLHCVFFGFLFFHITTAINVPVKPDKLFINRHNCSQGWNSALYCTALKPVLSTITYNHIRDGNKDSNRIAVSPHPRF